MLLQRVVDPGPVGLPVSFLRVRPQECQRANFLHIGVGLREVIGQGSTIDVNETDRVSSG